MLYFFTVLEYAEHGDLFALWCCTPNRQVPLEITRLYSSEISLALGALCVCLSVYMSVCPGTRMHRENPFILMHIIVLYRFPSFQTYHL